jgi:hypothetical protein
VALSIAGLVGLADRIRVDRRQAKLAWTAFGVYFGGTIGLAIAVEQVSLWLQTKAIPTPLAAIRAAGPIGLLVTIVSLVMMWRRIVRDQKREASRVV